MCEPNVNLEQIRSAYLIMAYAGLRSRKLLSHCENDSLEFAFQTNKSLKLCNEIVIQIIVFFKKLITEKFVLLNSRNF